MVLLRDGSHYLSPKAQLQNSTITTFVHFNYRSATWETKTFVAWMPLHQQVYVLAYNALFFYAKANKQQRQMYWDASQRRNWILKKMEKYAA